MQAQPNRSVRRTYGTGRLFIKHGAWYGSWRTAEGSRVTRKIGRGSQSEAENVLRQMMRGDKEIIHTRVRASSQRRVGAPPIKTPGVYFVVAESAGVVKIGQTHASLAHRLAGLQTMSPVRVELHRFIATSGPLWLERALHRQFAGSRHHGEWFDVAVLSEIDPRRDDEVMAWLRETGAWAARTPSGLRMSSADSLSQGPQAMERAAIAG